MTEQTPAERLVDAVRAFHHELEQSGEPTSIVLLWESTRIDPTAPERGNTLLVPAEHYSVPLGTPAAALGLARGFTAYAAGQVAAAMSGADPDEDDEP